MKLTLKKETVRALAVKTSVRGGTGSPVMSVAIQGAYDPAPGPSGVGVCLVGHPLGGLASRDGGGEHCSGVALGNSIYQHGP